MTPTAPPRVAKLALVAAVAQLRKAGIEDPARDARLLLAFAMNLPPERLSLCISDTLDEATAGRFAGLIAARSTRQPVAQIIGQRLFYGRPFIVTPDTLDPRPDTETLITEALSAPFTNLLDIGTGTGAILLTLLAERVGAMGVATDISAAALAVAAQNAAALGLDGRARFLQTSWLDGVRGDFDLVVSNPPYIAAAAMAGLAPEVRDHEPHIALTDGGDGLAAYRAIAQDAPRVLRPGGRLVFEIGWDQGRAVSEILAAAEYKDIHVIPDIDLRDRVVAARLS